ncbi:uncharacterized protein LOC127258958 isoform X2 [Andrographis paniculata]|uniref:uncharacterized protein LOC127258958 isoform X2 n=1 Tax=Andrographis paniculata TaxID=175694 RepID=UPI0021E93D5E|nr:uncharacterized protein LOC127258958 isoform X2 [Andrographis paniculata]
MDENSDLMSFVEEKEKIDDLRNSYLVDARNGEKVMKKAKLAVGWSDSLLFSTGGFDSHPSSQMGYDGNGFGPYLVGAIDSDEVVMETLENMVHHNIDTPLAAIGHIAWRIEEAPMLTILVLDLVRCVGAQRSKNPRHFQCLKLNS